MPATPEELTALMAKLGCGSFKVHQHAAVVTVDEMMAAIKGVKGGRAKNLLLRDKKKKTLFMVSALHDTNTPTRFIEQSKKIKSGNLRLASEDVLMESLGVIKGSLSPFALMNDTEHSVTFLMDSKFEAHDTLCFHPLTNTATAEISRADLATFLAHIGVSAEVMEFPEAGAAPEPAANNGGKKKGGAKPKGGGQGTKKKNKDVKGKTKLGVASGKAVDFATWYSDTIVKAEMIEYYDVSGCYILRPWSYNIWESIRDWFDAEIKKMGVQNSYFPIFVTKKALCKEEDHVEGFAAEVAWVTKSGQSELEEPIAVRPTSETVMYPAYAKWIRSHRDLPLKLNQWNNVVRWEFKNPTPFIRSREFLWQEGHTAYATLEEAAVEVMQVLELYRGVYEDLLCVPVIKGKKSEKEKFAGGHYTTTIEGFIPSNGRAIQAATSHCLGTNFSKMFEIFYEDKQGVKQMVWQNSWGLTTRSIGVMVMVHGDDQGLVLPPRVAPIQVVIVPIPFKGKDGSYAEEGSGPWVEPTETLFSSLKKSGVRVELDDRDNYNPGWKYNHWEQKGVPLRIELGQKDIANESVVIVRRDTREKAFVKWADVARKVPEILAAMQVELLAKARKERDERVTWAEDWPAFMAGLNKMNMIRVPWCESVECEDVIGEKSAEDYDGDTTMSGKAKSLCIPFEQPLSVEGKICFVPGCGCPAKSYTLFGRSY